MVLNVTLERAPGAVGPGLDLIKRGHVPHIFFSPTVTVAVSTLTNGGVGFSPISPEEKVTLFSY